MDWQAVVAERARGLGLSRARQRELLALAGVGVPPAALIDKLPAALLGLAGLFAGLGLIFAVAANWGALSRPQQFAVLQATVVLGAAGLIAWPRLRLPLGLWCLLCTGGLLAYFGQTYQTGADAWLLFALWSALCLPLALGVRADALWSAWVLVALTAVSLWMATVTAHRWRMDDDAHLLVHLPGWALALVLVLAAHSPAGRRAGAGPWARRTAACLAAVMVTTTAVVALFGSQPGLEVTLALAVLAAMAAATARPASFEVFTLSAAALGLNVLLMGLWVRWLFSGRSHGGEITLLLVTGGLAAALLAATVAGVLRCQRAASGRGGRP